MILRSLAGLTATFFSQVVDVIVVVIVEVGVRIVDGCQRDKTRTDRHYFSWFWPPSFWIKARSLMNVNSNDLCELLKSQWPSRKG